MISLIGSSITDIDIFLLLKDNEDMTLAEQISELAPDEIAAVTSLVEHFRQKKYESFVREKVALAEEDFAAGREVSHEEVVANLDTHLTSLGA